MSTSQPHAASGRKLSTKRKLLFSVVCLLAMLLLAEGTLRLRAWIKYGSTSADVDGQLDFDEVAKITVPRAGYEVHSANQSITINSLGFRGSEFALDKPLGTIRIACVGASTTYCTGVSSNEAAWPEQLQAMLQKSYPEATWEVINAGVPGHRMADCLSNLRHRVLPLEPDLVIFYEANNQMASDTRKLAESRGLADRRTGAMSPLVRSLSNASLLFHLCYMNLTIAASDGQDSRRTLQGLPDDLPETYVSDLGELHRELIEHDIPLVLSCFAVKYRRNQPRATQIENADVAFYYMPWMSIDDLLSGIDLYNGALTRYATEHQVPIVTDVESIPPDAEHFVDCIHLNDSGCTLLAKRFQRLLEDSGLIGDLLDKRAGSAVQD